MPYRKYIHTWDELNGVESKVREVSIEYVDALFPGGQGREVAETAVFVSEYGWDGGEGAILPAEAGVDVSALTSVEAYIKNTDWTSVLA